MNGKDVAREIVARLYAYSGLHRLLLNLRDRRKATILVYHDPGPETLRAHLEYLSGIGNFIPLSTLVHAIRSRDWSRVPANPLVLMFDDGHRGNRALLDLFREFRVIPTILLCSHIVDTDRHFWWKSGAADVRKAKNMTSGDMYHHLRRETGYEPQREYPDRQALNLSELREMSPFVEFGSHTRFHPVLTKCDDAQCLSELSESKTALESLLGMKIVNFSYPNGDYSEREIRFLKASGYASGRTLDIGRNGIDADPYKLKAMPIGDDASIHVFRAQLSGFFGYLKYVRHGSLRGFRPPVI